MSFAHKIKRFFGGVIMASKTIEQSVRVLEGVSRALLAAKETFVKDKEEKDEVINKAFRIIKKELDFIEQNS